MGGASINMNSIQSLIGTVDKRNFWVTEGKDGHNSVNVNKNRVNINQIDQMNASLMSLNEKSFYSSFTRKEANQQAGKMFVQTKKETLEQFIRSKFGASTSSLGGGMAGEEQSTAISAAFTYKQELRDNRKILEELKKEDESDEKKPIFKVHEVDLRKIKITKVPIE